MAAKAIYTVMMANADDKVAIARMATVAAAMVLTAEMRAAAG